MSAPSTAIAAETSALRAIPAWQVRGILVGVPLVYLANSFSPWSYHTFVGLDRSYYVPFLVSLLVLHWLSTALVIGAVRRASGRLSEIGLHWQLPGAVAFVAVLVAAGGALIWVRATWPTGQPVPADAAQMIYPYTLAERWLWVLVSISAGFCEELIYRGFAIRVLQARGWRTWQAVGLAGIAFVLIHGIAGLFGFPLFFLFALVFSGIFLWRGSLAPGIYLHALFDLMAILAL